MRDPAKWATLLAERPADDRMPSRPWGPMRRLLAILLAVLAATPVAAVLEAGTALAADSGPALVPGALDGSVRVRTPGLDASDRWIVVLRSGTRLDAAKARATSLGIRQDHEFNGTFRGYSARLTAGQLAWLRTDANVETVVPDDIVSLTGQTTPTGVSRVFGQYNPITQFSGRDHRVNADVAIVDTGIDPHHVDLTVAGGYSCSTSSPTAWFDPNGHGTHVAGIVGALDNGYGVVGVAPGVRLWAVRILDTSGNGLLSWYVCGLDWIAAQRDPIDPSKPVYRRRWTVWNAATTARTSSSAKIVAVSVIWRERTLPNPREVVAYVHSEIRGSFMADINAIR